LNLIQLAIQLCSHRNQIRKRISDQSWS